MKSIVTAPDSFKGSISSADAGRAIAAGIKRILPGVRVDVVPIADGGEGTLDAVTLPERRFSETVTGPAFEKLTARWGCIGDCAVIEMAQAAGLILTGEGRRGSTATTYGVGELIKAALDRGFRRIMITAGGSASNEGGCGMACALGAVFRDKNGKSFIPVGLTLGEIEEIDLSGLDPRLAECDITIATDIKNPLLGDEGAVRVYGPQKGVIGNDLDIAEEGMTKYASMIEKMCARPVASVPGCGAGGGLPAFGIAFFGAKILRGIDTVLDAVGFDAKLEGAAAVITGEGKIDRQSLYGKTISGICALAAEKNVPVDCFVGAVGDDPEKLLGMGIRSIRAVTEIARDVPDAISNAAFYLEKMGSAWAEEHKSEFTE